MSLLSVTLWITSTFSLLRFKSSLILCWRFLWVFQGPKSLPRPQGGPLCPWQVHTAGCYVPAGARFFWPRLQMGHLPPAWACGACLGLAPPSSSVTSKVQDEEQISYLQGVIRKTPMKSTNTVLGWYRARNSQDGQTE